MPNIKSAKKRLRQSIVRNERNRAVKSSLRTTVKQAVVAIDSENKEAAVKAFRAASSELDSVAGKKVIHKNAARRKKSRLMKKINKLA